MFKKTILVIFSCLTLIAFIFESTTILLASIVPIASWLLASQFISWKFTFDNKPLMIHLLVFSSITINIIESALHPNEEFTRLNWSLIVILVVFVTASYIIYTMVENVRNVGKAIKATEIIQATLIALIPFGIVGDKIISSPVDNDIKVALLTYHAIDITMFVTAILLLMNASRKNVFYILLSMIGFGNVTFSVMTSFSTISGDMSNNPTAIIVLIYTLYLAVVLTEGYHKKPIQRFEETKVSYLLSSLLILLPVFAFLADGQLVDFYMGLTLVAFATVAFKFYSIKKAQVHHDFINQATNDFWSAVQYVDTHEELEELVTKTIEKNLNFIKDPNCKESIFVAENFTKVFATDSVLPDFEWVALKEIAHITEVSANSISERQAHILFKEKARWELLTQNSSELVFITDINGIVLESSPQTDKYFDFDFVGKEIKETFDVDYKTIGKPQEIQIDENFWDIKIVELKGDTFSEEAKFMIWAGNITDMVKTERFDKVTGLPNANSFQKTNLKNFKSLVSVNLKDFRQINDSYGYIVGDQLLNAIAQRASKIITPDDMLFRNNNDSFIILASCKLDEESVQDKLDQVFGSRFTINDEKTIKLQGNASVVDISEAEFEHFELLRQADTAMGIVKKENLNVIIYNNRMQVKAKDTLELQNKFLKASEDFSANGFEVHFQPIVDKNGKIYSVETLTRWLDSEGKAITFPDIFIGMAENLGLVNKLDEWMIRQGIQFVLNARKAVPDLKLQFNLSPVDLTADKLENLCNVVESLTEPSSVIMEFIETKADFKPLIPILNTMKAKGYGISIDDYGTGESNLQRVMAFPATQIKFAGELIEGAFVNPESMSKQIESMQARGCETIIEKIETWDEMNMLVKAGIDYAQGYLFAKPMPPQEALEWIEGNKINNFEIGLKETV